MKKIVGKLMIFVILIIMIILFFRDYIIKVYVEKKLNLEIGTLESSIKEKKIVLNNITYREEKKDKSEFYEIEKLEIYFNNISFEKKEINISKTEISGVNYRVEEHNRIVGSEFKNNTIKNELLDDLRNSTEKNYSENERKIKDILEENYKQKEVELNNILQPYKEKLLKLSETEQGKNIKKSVEKIKNIKSISDLFSKEGDIKNILKNSKEIFHKNIKEKEQIKDKIKELSSKKNIENHLLQIDNIKPDLILDSDIIDKIISIKINEELEGKIYEQVLIYRGMVEKIEGIKKEENKDLWKLNIDELNIEVSLFNTKLYGKILNLSSDLKNMKDIIKVSLKNNENKDKVTGEINLLKITGDLNLNIEGLSSKNILGLSEYLKSGNIFIQQNIEFFPQDITISGELKIKDMKLNNEKIVTEILKEKDIKFKENIEVVLNGILKRVDYLDVKYNYDSKNRKILIKSNLKSKIDEIFKNSKNDIAKEVFESRLLDFKNKKIIELIGNEDNK